MVVLPKISSILPLICLMPKNTLQHGLDSIPAINLLLKNDLTCCNLIRVTKSLSIKLIYIFCTRNRHYFKGGLFICFVVHMKRVSNQVGERKSAGLWRVKVCSCRLWFVEHMGHLMEDSFDPYTNYEAVDLS